MGIREGPGAPACGYAGGPEHPQPASGLGRVSRSGFQVQGVRVWVESLGNWGPGSWPCVHVCMPVCVRACVRVCVRACV